MNKRLLNLYSLKFNPFSSQLPATALWVSPPIQSFCWRIEHQIGEGGFALAVGDPGVGKSATLRILSEHLKGLRDLCVGTLTRPQAKMAEFYRELGHLFGVALSPNNRWHSSKTLREKWLAHIEAAVYRPVLIIDEAQEMNSLVLSELRLLASADLDSRSILTIILAGDARLATRFEEPDLLPIASRIRSRLRLEALPPKALQECLDHLLKAAGNPKLLAPSLILTLCEPKCCKSFLALDVAVSVASGAACLRQFPVRRSGPVLLFPAEDSLAVVRHRLEGIAAAAQVPFASLPVQVITAPSLRLDTPTDRQRLSQTVQQQHPVLLILDPLIRLHRVDENDATQIAALLSFLRELQRQFQLAVMLVHHARKDSHSSRPGQALRGSSELHGWGDSNLYLRRKGSQLTLQRRFE